MNRLYSAFLLCLVLGFFFSNAKADVWEKYCSSPEGAVIVGIQGDAANGLGVVTYSKTFIQSATDAVWSFAGNADLDEGKPYFYVGDGFMYSLFEQKLNQVSLFTKATVSVDLPQGVSTSDVKRIAAKGAKCAIWCAGDASSIRYIYDYSTKTWSEPKTYDYNYYDVYVSQGGIVWRNSYGEFGFDHRKSTDLGESWSDLFTNVSNDIFVDHLGNQYTYFEGVATKIDNSGNKIEDFPFLQNETPESIETFRDSKLLVQYSNSIVVIDIASKTPIDTIEFDPLTDGRLVGLAIVGKDLYVGTSNSVFIYYDLATLPVIDKSGLNAAMGLYLTPYKGKLLMRSVVGLYSIDQLGAVKLSGAMSNMENPSGRDMVVTSDSKIYLIDRMLRKLMCSTNDGQNWQEIVLPSGDVADYITEIQPVGLVVGTATGNKIYSIASGSTTPKLIATINYPENLEFQFIKLFGSTVVVVTDQLIFRSIDMGSNWTGTPSTVFSTVSDMFSMGEGIIWLASQGKFYESTDDGESWTEISEEYNFLYPLQLPDKSIMFAHATTYDTYIIHPDKSITKFAYPAPDKFISSLCLFEGYVYATTIGGEIYRFPYSVLPAEEQPAWEQVSAFPVPASELVTISLGGASAGDAIIEVFNSLGEKQNVRFAIEGNEAKLNVASLPQGVYTARIMNQPNATTTKFVIAR